MPRAVVSTSAKRSSSTAIPLPMGAVAASLSCRAVSRSSALSSRLSATPPAASIAACCATAASQASCPCRSIIALAQSSGTVVRSDAVWPASEKLPTVTSWLPINPIWPAISSPPISTTGAPRNQVTASARVITSALAEPSSTGGALDGFRIA